jgi:hypothetical protein
MRHIRRIGLLSVALLGRGVPAPAPEVGLPGLVVEIAVDSLKDVALALYTPARGTILYNPSLHRQLGPALSAFFRAHEFGHLYHHHTRHGAPGASELRAFELQADCYAARRLAATRPEAITAAIAFFTGPGRAALDHEHPAGAARAAAIRKCAR